MGVGGSGQRAAAQGGNAGALEAFLQAFPVALKRPEVRQPPVRNKERLGLLIMRVARKQDIEVSLCPFHQCGLQLVQGGVQLFPGADCPEAEIGGNLVIAAASGMQFPCQGAHQFGQAAFHGGMNILVAFSEGELVVFKFALNYFQVGADKNGFFRAEYAGFSKAPRPRQYCP